MLCSEKEQNTFIALSLPHTIPLVWVILQKKKINLSIFEPFGEIQNEHYHSKVWVGKLFLMFFKSIMLIQ